MQVEGLKLEPEALGQLSVGRFPLVRELHELCARLRQPSAAPSEFMRDCAHF